jgi:RNA polymerase sigma-70 factor (ECF subfamily)
MSALSPTLSRIDLVERDRPAAARSDALDRFLRGIERRALRMAELATGNRDDALELVQEAMLGFVRRYGDKPAADWAPLFYRVLDSRLLDFHRRSTVRRRWRLWLSRDEDDGDPLEQVPDPREPGPDRRVADGELRERLDAALRALPPRQRQAFLLRIWEGLDVADTATAMRVSDGSVKTHLSRALAALRARLGDLT